MSDLAGKKCFVIGPIGAVGSETRKAADFLLRGIIRPALADLKLQIWRADEDSRPGMITDRLIIDLHEADVVIADLTDLNPNAFYELGIRHASVKPTVHIASNGTKLPFDNSGYLAIFFDKTDWDSIEQAKRELRRQCELSLSPDFVTSNPVAQAISVKAFNASDIPIERTVGDILKRIESLEISSTSLSKNDPESLYYKFKNTYERECHLISTIKNLAKIHGYEKYGITDKKIESFAVEMSDQLSFDHALRRLESSDFEVVLFTVGKQNTGF